MNRVGSVELGRKGILAVACLAATGVVSCGDRSEPRVQTVSAEERAVSAAGFPRVGPELLNAGSAAENWAVHGGSYRNWRYSILDQVGLETVRDLVPVWIHQTGLSESFTTTPIVVGNTMYVTTAESRVLALNAASGEKLWEYVPELEATPLCCGPNNRGVAAYGSMVYVGTLDGRLVALDHRTGDVEWEARVGDPEDGESVTMAPLAADDRVYVGISGGKYGARGHVTAYDAETGSRVWRWHTVPAPGEGPDGGWWGEWRETDPFGLPLNRNIEREREDSARYAQAWRRGGGAVWTTPAYDAERGLLYVVVGNPAPGLDGVVRPGDNLYTGSIVALDAEDGELVWYFQYLPHDIWDLSGGSPPFLFEAGGRRLVGHAAKTGWLYVVDAETGDPVLRSQNFVPQENMFARPTEQGVRILPGANGGNNWSPVAYSPETGLAYVLGVHQPMVYARTFQPREPGRLWLGGSFHHIPDEEQWGTLTAIDLSDGMIRWQKRVPTPMIGGALVTAGGILFVGQGHGTFDAFDASTGDLLWQFHAGAGVHGGPVTFEVDGIQYVTVAAGGLYHLDTPRGGALLTFALGGSHRSAPRDGDYPAANFVTDEPYRYGAVRQVPGPDRESPPADVDDADEEDASATGRSPG